MHMRACVCMTVLKIQEKASSLHAVFLFRHMTLALSFFFCQANLACSETEDCPFARLGQAELP